MATTTSQRKRTQSIPDSLETPLLLGLYEQMVLIRRFELAAQEVYKKGEIPGFIHLYIGQEATAVGVCAHLRTDDWITSTHRGHGHALAKGVPAQRVMAELYGKATGCCGGRGGSMHLYSPAEGLLGTNGFVGGGIPATVGLGISATVRGTDQVAVAFFGDGAVNHGAFHEAVNFAGAQNAPVIFVCENNLYATATPLTTATRNARIADKALAYGIPGVAVDGNDVVAVWQATRQAVERARAGQGPTLIEAKTYRTVGHHEGDPLVGTYRTQQELDEWKARCPILNFRKRLIACGRAGEKEMDAIETEVQRHVEKSLEFARKSPMPDPATANDHVWAQPLHPAVPIRPEGQQTRVQSWLEAVRDGIAEEMRHDPHIIYMGEGTGERGGSFAHTKNLWQEFGGHRMLDTPICELGFTGAAIGASAGGCRTVADLMFADFLFEAATQIVHQAGKLRYMSNGQVCVPMVVRASWGTVKSTGPHHSGTYHSVWAHCPGLIVVVPSNPADAKGLMKSALRAHDPVIFLEPKSLFSMKGPVPAGEHYVPLGQAAVVRPGKDLTIVSCGTPLHRCLEAAQLLDNQALSCEVIDLRTIVPLDVDTIAISVAKTGRLLVVDEGFAMCGLGAEITAAMMERVFYNLEAPIARLHTDPVAQPFSPTLENQVVITLEKIVASAQAVVNGHAVPVRRLQCQSSRNPAAGPALTTPRTVQPQAPTGQPQSPIRGIPIMMPHQDLTITEATVLKWLKRIGDRVIKGEELVEVETDKAVVPLESPSSGRLVQILAPEKSVINLGQTVGIIEPQTP